MDSTKPEQEPTNKDLEADEVIPISHHPNHEIQQIHETDQELPPVQHFHADVFEMQREEFEMDTQHIPPFSNGKIMETNGIKPNPLQGLDASQRVSDATGVPQPMRVYQVWPGKNVSYGFLLSSSFLKFGVYNFQVFCF